MKNIYRLEIFNIGIYQWRKVKHKISTVDLKILELMSNQYDSDFKNYPTIFEDGFFNQLSVSKIKIENCISGCETIEKLKSWFGSFFIRLLQIDGVKIVKYESKKVFIGNSKKQILAYKPKKRKIITLRKVNSKWCPSKNS